MHPALACVVVAFADHMHGVAVGIGTSHVAAALHVVGADDVTHLDAGRFKYRKFCALQRPRHPHDAAVIATLRR